MFFDILTKNSHQLHSLISRLVTVRLQQVHSANYTHQRYRNRDRNDEASLAWPWSMSMSTFKSRWLPAKYLQTATLHWAALYSIYITERSSVTTAGSLTFITNLLAKTDMSNWSKLALHTSSWSNTAWHSALIYNFFFFSGMHL